MVFAAGTALFKARTTSILYLDLILSACPFFFVSLMGGRRVQYTELLYSGNVSVFLSLLHCARSFFINIVVDRFISLLSAAWLIRLLRVCIYLKRQSAIVRLKVVFVAAAAAFVALVDVIICLFFVRVDNALLVARFFFRQKTFQLIQFQLNRICCICVNIT